MQTKKPTIFLLSGGAFVQLDNQKELNTQPTSINNDLKLAYKLTEGGANNVIYISYSTMTDSIKTKINKLFEMIKVQHFNNCQYTNGTEAKTLLELASLTSFKDLRKQLNEEINIYNSNIIDKNNVFIAGISASAILSIYSVFLDSSEIPSSLSYTNCSDSTFTINTETLKTDYYPIPKIRGIIPMAGGSFYSDIFNYTSHSAYTAVNLMHGTCDELINQNQGRVIYKFLIPTEYNNFDADRYPLIYGSKYIYNKLLNSSHQKTGFGQVIKGGHNVIGEEPNINIIGGWDIYNTIGTEISLRDPVYSNISIFMKRAMGINGYLPWNNHAYSVFPDKSTIACINDDLSLINPPINTYDTICKNINYTASLINPPLTSTLNISWSVSSGLQIIGLATGSSIIYKAISSGTKTITATVSYFGNTYVVKKDIVVNALTPIFPTPTVSPLNYDFACTDNRTLTLSNLPSINSISWSSSGNISIVSYNGASVTYKSNSYSYSYSTGTLIATITTPCETKQFSYNITTYATTGGYAVGIISDCETGVILNSPTKLVKGSTVTFTALFTNAINYGITGAEWDFTCGNIISGPIHYMIGTSLRSEITVNVNNNLSLPCGEIMVKPIQYCEAPLWKIKDTEYGSCSGGGWQLKSHPNPSSDELFVSLYHEDENLANQKYLIEIVDITANIVSKLYIENGKQEINTSHLQPGLYKIIIHTEDDLVTGSFIIKR